MAYCATLHRYLHRGGLPFKSYFNHLSGEDLLTQAKNGVKIHILGRYLVSGELILTLPGRKDVEIKDRSVISEPQLSDESLGLVLRIVRSVDNRRFTDDDDPRSRDRFMSVIQRMV